MALGVCMLFDDSANRALRGLWDRLEERGVPTLRSHTHGKHRPHLSYAVLIDWELERLRVAVEALPDRGPFQLTFDAVAAFRRGRVSLVPACPPDLLPRQREVVRAAREAGAVVHRHYETGRWLPHCALAPRAQLEQLPIVAATVYDILPLTVVVTATALIDSSTGQVWPLGLIP